MHVGTDGTACKHWIDRYSDLDFYAYGKRL